LFLKLLASSHIYNVKRANFVYSELGCVQRHGSKVIIQFRAVVLSLSERNYSECFEFMKERKYLLHYYCGGEGGDVKTMPGDIIDVGTIG